MKKQQPTNGRRKTKEQLKEELKNELREEVKKELEDEILKKKKRADLIFTIFDTMAMLCFTAIGIIIAKYIPAFRAGEEIKLILPSWGRLLISFILSMGVVGASEIKGSVEGKKKNWVIRCWRAISNGLGWFTILGF